MTLTALKPKANADVVDLLKRLLVEAERGELRSISAIYDCTDRTVGSAQAGDWDAPQVLFAFECWRHRMLHGQQKL